jgi:hypothetical protein
MHICLNQHTSKNVEDTGYVSIYLGPWNEQTKPKFWYIIRIKNFVSSFIHISPHVCSSYLLTVGEDENNIANYIEGTV